MSWQTRNRIGTGAVVSMLAAMALLGTDGSSARGQYGGPGAFGQQRPYYGPGFGQPDPNAQAPAPEVQAAPDPASTQPSAQEQTAAAMAKLSASQMHLKSAFQNSDEYKNALADQRRAQGEYDRAAKNAVAKLANKPEYQSALADRKSADAAMSAARSDTATPPDKIATLAQRAMTSRSVVTRMESEAVAGDPAAVDAKAKLLQSGTKLAQLVQKFNDGVKTDPDYVAARQQLDDLHAPVNTAPVVQQSAPQTQPAAPHASATPPAKAVPAPAKHP